MVELELQPGETRTTTDPVVRLTVPAGTFVVQLVVVTKDKRRSAPVALTISSGPEPA